MSLRFPSAGKWASVAPIIVCVLALGVGVQACAAPAVQTYTNQAVPMGAGPDDPTFDSPVAAGTITLQDVLEANKPAQPPSLPALTPAAPDNVATATAPLMAPAAQPSSTAQMMSQGMQEVLEKLSPTTKPAAASSAATQPSLPLPPLPLPPSASTSAATPAAAAPAQPTAPATVDGVTYQPGQEPKNLATGQPEALAPAAAEAAASTPPAAPAPAPSPAVCYKDIKKWQKTCAEVGYPANYVGKIEGETRTACADGSLHDFWVSNSCAPPVSTAEVKADGVCGEAANNAYDNAPSTNLCSSGTPSSVSGDGPWSWACAGNNGGSAAACTANKRVASIDGACGDANGLAVETAPSSDLCETGTASAVTGDGPWHWSCRGQGGGASQSCIAPSSVASSSSPAPEPAVSPEPSAATPPEAASPAAVSGAKPSLCGEAAETLAYQAPDHDLCRVGSPSPVNGDGPWSWSCTDNDGSTSSCSTLSLSGGAPEAQPATLAPAEPAVPQAAPTPEVSTSPATASPVTKKQIRPESGPSCGLAASEPAPEQPSTDLCAEGKASAVRGNGPWVWTCRKGRAHVSCATPKMVDASCGPANGTALQSAPFAGLCAAGTPSGIDGNGPWSWTCNGSGGGVSVKCAASMQAQINGACGVTANTAVTSAPGAGLCASGSPSAVNGNGPWTWSCAGANGGDSVPCSADKAAPPPPPGPKLDGLCGSDNGVVSSGMPPADGLCANGSATQVVGNGPWNWSCVGENGGMTVSCTAPLQPPAPLDGACGGANGVPTLVQPQNGLCAAGVTGSVSGSGPWTWTCSGVNGGNAAACQAPLAGGNASLPSVMTPSSSKTSVKTPAPAPSASGLVTPQLPSPSALLPALDKNVIPSLSTPTLPPRAAAASEAAQAAAAAPTPVLQDGVDAASSIPGNHLVLDPTISTIVFTHGSGNIDDSVLDALNRLASVLTANPDVRITLIAYADNAGSTPRDARRLSLQRALAVRDYLGSKGIDSSRIDVRAEGANVDSGYMDRVDIKVND